MTLSSLAPWLKMGEADVRVRYLDFYDPRTDEEWLDDVHPEVGRLPEQRDVDPYPNHDVIVEDLPPLRAALAVRAGTVEPPVMIPRVRDLHYQRWMLDGRVILLAEPAGAPIFYVPVRRQHRRSESLAQFLREPRSWARCLRLAKPVSWRLDTPCQSLEELFQESATWATLLENTPAPSRALKGFTNPHLAYAKEIARARRCARPNRQQRDAERRQKAVRQRADARRKAVAETAKAWVRGVFARKAKEQPALNAHDADTYAPAYGKRREPWSEGLKDLFLGVQRREYCLDLVAYLKKHAMYAERTSGLAISLRQRAIRFLELKKHTLSHAEQESVIANAVMQAMTLSRLEKRQAKRVEKSFPQARKSGKKPGA